MTLACQRDACATVQSSNIFGGTNPPNSRSISSASFSGVRSSSQGPRICTPIGRPSGAKPVGIAVDTNPAKLQLATKLGATDIVDPRNGDVVSQVRELTKGGAHHAFEVLGRKETAEQCFAMLAPGGTATIVGMIPFGQKIELHGFDFLRERRIQGSSMGSNHFRVDMPRLVEFYMRGRLHLEDWISAKLKLSEINEGFANMKAGKTLRSVIVFDK